MTHRSVSMAAHLRAHRRLLHHTYLAVPVIFVKNRTSAVYAIEAISFLHGRFQLCVHVVGEDAAHNHVTVTRVLDKFLNTTCGMAVNSSQIPTHGEHAV